MINFDLIREELEKIITPKTVFACIGTKNAVFDSFGPLCGTLLESKGVPCYGTKSDMMNATTMNYMMNIIYNIDKINNEDIIAIDACVAAREHKLNKVDVRDAGVRPGAAVGHLFPTVGRNSIVMYTLTKTDLRDTISMYNKYGIGSYVGKRYDKCDQKLIREYANKITDIIAEIYHEACALSTIW